MCNLCMRLSLPDSEAVRGEKTAKKDEGLKEANGKKSRMDEGLNISHPGSH